MVLFIFYVNDLDFIVSGSSIKKIVKASKKIVVEIIKWGKLNAVTYNMLKREVMLFLKSH